MFLLVVLGGVALFLFLLAVFGFFLPTLGMPWERLDDAGERFAKRFERKS